VEESLAGLTLDQKIGQMLHPFLIPRGARDFVSDCFKGIEPGGVFIFPGTIAETKNCAMLVQKNVVVPAIISSDLENGEPECLGDADGDCDADFFDFAVLAWDWLKLECSPFTTTASSQESPAYPASMAIDGSFSTRW